MNIRETGYWLLDKTKGSPVKKKYKELVNNKKTNHNNEKELVELLDYARKNVPFYKNITESKLSAFPVIRKEDIKKDYESFRSQEYLNEDELITLYTSGSSGTPFKAYQNHEKDQYHKADLILLNEEIGWNIGDRWAHMRNWGFGQDASKKELFIKNMVPISVLNVNDEKLEKMVETLSCDKKLHIILGYASGLERLVNYIVEHNYQDKDYSIKLIIADSDNLKSETWDLMEKIFKCPVLNRYGSIENGIIALTRENDRTFYVQTSQFYVEILKMNEDVSVDEGEEGRVVLTDLRNKALPFIRYYNGDLAIAKKIVNGQCTQIGSLQGREISALRRTDGTVLSETNIMGHFKKFTDVGRYQIIQEKPKEYLMRIESDINEIDEKLVAELKEIFGDDAVITITHVDEIEIGKNGKFKVTISKL